MVELAEGRYALRVWRNGFWSDSLSEGARVDVEEVRTGVWLTAIQQIPIESDRGSGNLELRVSRARERKLGGLRFRVEMSHDLPELILVNLALRFHLGGAAMTAEDKGNKVELKPLPCRCSASSRSPSSTRSPTRASWTGGSTSS